MYKSLATLAFVLILVGAAKCRVRKIHVPLVLAGIGLDLALVLTLELSRDVIAMTVEKDWSWMQWTHIGSSVLAVLLYFPVVGTGVSILRGAKQRSTWTAHRGLATAALACRAVGFGFMWTV